MKMGQNIRKITTYFETLDKNRVELKSNPFKLSSNSVQDGCVGKEGVGVSGPVESSANLKAKSADYGGRHGNSNKQDQFSSDF